MTATYLREADVTAALDYPTAIQAVAEAFRQLAAGRASNVPRDRAMGKGIVVHTMSATADYLGLVGWKAYVTTRLGAKFHVALYGQQTGEMLALLEANHLGQIRTGATTAVAVDALAHAETRELGLFGTGFQAEGQLSAVCAVRKIEQAFVYSRSTERCTAFAERMSEKLAIEVIPVDLPEEAAEELPLVITATNSAEPVFGGACLSPGTLVCAIGANWPQRAEVDSDTVAMARNAVCDSVECCRREAGDFTEALEKGLLDWSQVVELSAVLTGEAIGRQNRDSIVLFKSVGMALEDVAVAAVVCERARREGLGSELPF